MSEVEDVADRLHSAAIHLLRFVRRQADRSDISPAQASALSVLVYAGPLTIGGLAEAEQVRSPTITRVVEQLVREGLAERKPSTTDARSTLVRATEAGTRMIRDGRRRRVAALAARLEGLTPDEVRALRAASELIGRAIGHSHHE